MCANPPTGFKSPKIIGLSPPNTRSGGMFSASASGFASSDEALASSSCAASSSSSALGSGALEFPKRFDEYPLYTGKILPQNCKGSSICKADGNSQQITNLFVPTHSRQSLIHRRHGVWVGDKSLEWVLNPPQIPEGACRIVPNVRSLDPVWSWFTKRKCRVVPPICHAGMVVREGDLNGALTDRGEGRCCPVVSVQAGELNPGDTR
eukprot:755846-Hanusia_phi.AAC.2